MAAIRKKILDQEDSGSWGIKVQSNYKVLDSLMCLSHLKCSINTMGKSPGPDVPYPVKDDSS